ncbi:N-formylglutamate amidohydrolase [Rhodobacteraceae bacterium CCMM004]|nr:N-formylglutamate amidohydrolase [Rhodobacteraceae bacterium CCMM004]
MHDTPPLTLPHGAAPVAVHRPEGRGRAVVVCEHAAAAIPADLGDLGLTAADRLSHAVWDPGAGALAAALSARLDAPLVAGTVSRLVHDCNRPDGSAAACPERVERIAVPGNVGLTAAARSARAARVAAPFHAAVARTLDAAPADAALITVHSFTPVWNGTPRQTRLGLLHDTDARLARAMAATLRPRAELNRPYGPEDGVTHMLARHALPRSLRNVMIEVRSDLLVEPGQVAALADRLARALTAALSDTAAEAAR